MIARVLLVCLVVGCVLSNPPPTNIRYHLSTKTMYWPPSEGEYTPPPEGCQPVQLNLLARHGARYPGSSDIKSLTTLQNTMHANAQYFYPEYQWMATWINPYNTNQNDLLTYSGQVEHYNLAQRMIGNYTDILTQRYEPYTYDMQCTQKSRTCMSGSSYSFSMLQNSGHLPPRTGHFQPSYMYTQSPDADLTLRFFDNCPQYDVEVTNNVTANEQTILYEAQVLEQAHNLSVKIGVYPHWNITASDMQLMYKTCGYEIAITNTTDQFCMLFDQEMTRVLEYSQDLATYYQNGYGYDINYQMGCLLWKEFLDIHQGYANGTNTELKAKLRFAHAETVMPLLCLIGLFKDSSPLLASWTPEEIAQRRWKSSDISPFAANIITVLYQCDDEYYLKLLVNEREQVFPGCSDVYCPLSDVLSIYSDELACPFIDICYPGSSPCEMDCPCS